MAHYDLRYLLTRRAMKRPKPKATVVGKAVAGVVYPAKTWRSGSSCNCVHVVRQARCLIVFLSFVAIWTGGIPLALGSNEESAGVIDTQEPNKDVVFLFGISECKEAKLTSAIKSIISDAAKETLARRHRAATKNSPQRSEESVQPEVAAGPTQQTRTGTARSSTIYTLQQETLAVFREEPKPPLCQLDSTTLHHLNCQMVSLKNCASFIDPEILKELALKRECVSAADFDYKAWPIDGGKGSMPVELRPLSQRFPEEIRGNDAVLKKELKDWPNDPHLLSGAQWELVDSIGIQAKAAWKISKGGGGTIAEQPINTVAIIDFGFNLVHEDLFDSWWRNAVLEDPDFSEWPDNCFDGIDNDGNGYVDDCIGYSFANRSPDPAAFAGEHGTAVASTCCATTNNGRGVASLGWNLRPMALKVDGSYSQIAEALNYAADKRVSVVNMSFGGPPSAALRAALAVAAARDMILIVAAGNHNCDFASVALGGCRSQHGTIKGFPAGYGDVFPNVVVVAAVAQDGQPAKYTNFDSSSNPKIHVLAPGDSILTCSNWGIQGYARASGTSFATPIVAALAALIRYESPELTAEEIKGVLVNSCNRVPSAMLERVAKCGGIISAAKALRNAGILPRYTK